MIKKLLLVPAICSLTQIAPAFTNVDQHRTVAMSALNSVVDRRSNTMKFIPLDASDGADIILMCINQVFTEWGRVVIQSVVADPSAHDDNAMDKYYKVSENVQSTRKFMADERGDLTPNVDAVRKEFVEKGLWPAVPEDLSFLTYEKHDKTYYQLLVACNDQEYVDAVAARIAPLDFDKLIDGSNVLTGLVATSLGSNSSMNGIVAGEPSAAQTNMFNKTQTYSEWIRNLTKY